MCTSLSALPRPPRMANGRTRESCAAVDRLSTRGQRISRMEFGRLTRRPQAARTSMSDLKSIAARLVGQISQQGASPSLTETAAQLGFAFGRERRWRYAASALLLAGRSDPLERGWGGEVAKCALQLTRDGVAAPLVPLPSERAHGRISFVVCSITPSKLATLRANLDQLIHSKAWELIHIDDARSLAEGYNRGLDQTTGELVVLCHDDIVIFGDDFEAKLRCYLAEFDVIGVAGSTKMSGPSWLWAGLPHLWCWVGHPRDDSPAAMASGLRGPCVRGAQLLDGLFFSGETRGVRSGALRRSNI